MVAVERAAEPQDPAHRAPADVDVRRQSDPAAAAPACGLAGASAPVVQKRAEIAAALTFQTRYTEKRTRERVASLDNRPCRRPGVRHETQDAQLDGDKRTHRRRGVDDGDAGDAERPGSAAARPVPACRQPDRGRPAVGGDEPDVLAQLRGADFHPRAPAAPRAGHGPERGARSRCRGDLRRRTEERHPAAGAGARPRAARVHVHLPGQRRARAPRAGADAPVQHQLRRDAPLRDARHRDDGHVRPGRVRLRHGRRRERGRLRRRLQRRDRGHRREPGVGDRHRLGRRVRGTPGRRGNAALRGRAPEHRPQGGPASR